MRFFLCSVQKISNPELMQTLRKMRNDCWKISWPVRAWDVSSEDFESHPVLNMTTHTYDIYDVGPPHWEPVLSLLDYTDNLNTQSVDKALIFIFYSMLWSYCVFLQQQHKMALIVISAL